MGYLVLRAIFYLEFEESVVDSNGLIHYRFVFGRWIHHLLSNFPLKAIIEDLYERILIFPSELGCHLMELREV